MKDVVRSKLRNVVTRCRKLLEESISQQLQGQFGIYAGKKDTVQIDDEPRMTHLSDEDKQYRRDLIDHFEHIRARGFKDKDALDQLIREIAFTHLNRLCAYKMMEAREVYVGGRKFREAVSRGINSNGFKFYLADHPEDERLFNTGKQDVAYRHFLDWLGGLLSEEIGVLFSPNDPANRLYPRQKTLDELIDLLNGTDIKPEETELREAWPTIWAQDETIGWVYQYFTPKELRDQARKDSSAPRNSHELAFRNQFFTPRYVVEFLSDNTLGRIWYEMRKGGTKITDQCRYMVRRPNEVFLAEGQAPPKSIASQGGISQKTLLKQPVHIPHRPKKDPRELKILDPACGSGHFLLYCFDLFMAIYLEAYSDPDLGPALQKDYPTLTEFQKEVPRLILKHNLHGIEIDLRCTQIAALALWLRCQRAYQEMGLKEARPTITRSNLVCAEPMPGEQQMLKDFVTQLEPRLLGQLVEVVFNKMTLAGEAGSLLRIEDEIQGAVGEARRQWLTGPVHVQQTLFGEPEPVVRQQRFDFSGITDAQFFEQMETRVIEALRSYSEQSQNGHRLQRRLFTEDVVRGFAFVDICRQRFDVVLMNPPFGQATQAGNTYSDTVFPTHSGNLACAFVSRAQTLLANGGFHGAICDNSTAIRSSYEDFRKDEYLGSVPIRTWITLGWEVLDANVEVYLMTRGHSALDTPLVGLDYRYIKDKEARLRVDAASQYANATHLSIAHIRRLPNMAIDVSWPSFLIHAFIDNANLEEAGQRILTGHQLEADRHYRLYWELFPYTDVTCSSDWAFAFKGGEYSPAYLPADYVAFVGPGFSKVPSKSANVLRNGDFHFRAGVGYGKRGEFVDAQPLRSDTFFTHEGFAFISESTTKRAHVLALLNSKFFNFGINKYCGQHKTNGYVNLFPLPNVPPTAGNDLQRMLRDVLVVKTRWWTTTEQDFLFDRPLALQFFHTSLHDTATRVWNLEHEDLGRLTSLWNSINEILYSVYGVDQQGVQEVEEYCSRMPQDTLRPWLEGTTMEAHKREIAVELVSYLVGVTYRLFDTRKRDRSMGDAFDDFFKALPLPRPCLPVSMARYLDGPSVLVDCIGDANDIVGSLARSIEELWGEYGPHIERELCESLRVSQLREYFRKHTRGGFWDDHLRRYSRGHRKAPIYWLLQSSKRSYALWLYYHRLDKDLLFKALWNYVEPKIQQQVNLLKELRVQYASVGDSTKKAREFAKDIEKQEDLLFELQDFEERLRRVANLNLVPDLNDGVALNIAPLYELVPWSEAEKYWKELLEGKYEWSSIGKQLREKGLVREG